MVRPLRYPKVLSGLQLELVHYVINNTAIREAIVGDGEITSLEGWKHKVHCHIDAHNGSDFSNCENDLDFALCLLDQTMPKQRHSLAIPLKGEEGNFPTDEKWNSIPEQRICLRRQCLMFNVCSVYVFACIGASLCVCVCVHACVCACVRFVCCVYACVCMCACTCMCEWVFMLVLF